MEHQLKEIQFYIAEIRRTAPNNSRLILFGSSAKKKLALCNDIDIAIVHDSSTEQVIENIAELNLTFEVQLDGPKYRSMPFPPTPPPRPTSPPTPTTPPRQPSTPPSPNPQPRPRQAINKPVHIVVIHEDEFKETEVFKRNHDHMIELNSG